MILIYESESVPWVLVACEPVFNGFVQKELEVCTNCSLQVTSWAIVGNDVLVNINQFNTVNQFKLMESLNDKPSAEN